MYTYKIKLDRVVDGDTIDAYIDLGFDVSVKKRIRFVGINTPESRTRDLEEKAKGLAAKQKSGKAGKYRRSSKTNVKGVRKKGATLRDWFRKEDWRQVNNPKKKCGEK